MTEDSSTHSRLLTPEAANRWRYRVMRGVAPNGVLAMVDEIERLYEQYDALLTAAHDLYDDAGVDDIDARLDYLYLQVGRDTWNAFVAQLTDAASRSA